MADATITLRIEEEFELRVSDVWPDGNAPEHPTADDVKALMSGRVERVMQDWNLEVSGIEVIVSERVGDQQPLWRTENWNKTYAVYDGTKP